VKSAIFVLRQARDAVKANIKHYEGRSDLWEKDREKTLSDLRETMAEYTKAIKILREYED
jgi:hypothetical protein